MTCLKKERPLKSYTVAAAFFCRVLKRLCKKLNVSENFQKKTRIIFVCHAFRISTAGNISSFKDISANVLTFSSEEPSMTNWDRKFVNWLVSCARYREPGVKQILLNNVMDGKTARVYKLSSPNQLKDNIHSMCIFNNSKTQTFLQFSVWDATLVNQPILMTRQSCSSSYTRFLVIPTEFCTCTVGNTGRWRHAVAALFLMFWGKQNPRWGDIVHRKLVQMD